MSYNQTNKIHNPFEGEELEKGKNMPVEKGRETEMLQTGAIQGLIDTYTPLDKAMYDYPKVVDNLRLALDELMDTLVFVSKLSRTGYSKFKLSDYERKLVQFWMKEEKAISMAYNKLEKLHDDAELGARSLIGIRQRLNAQRQAWQQHAPKEGRRR